MPELPSTPWQAPQAARRCGEVVEGTFAAVWAKAAPPSAANKEPEITMRLNAKRMVILGSLSFRIGNPIYRAELLIGYKQ